MQRTHFFGITIENASVAELKHAWVADNHNVDANQVIHMCGGVTQSILDGYTNQQLAATWEHFKSTIRTDKAKSSCNC